MSEGRQDDLDTSKVTIVVHGGAWKIPVELYEASSQGVKHAAIQGYRLLENGGDCVDAVVRAVSCLEDDPCFDAGKGSVLNERSEIEMHAMVMRGDTCDIGGVVGVKTIKNPVQAAQVVLYESHHCMMDAEASLKLARTHNLPEADLDYFVTSNAREEFKQQANFSASMHQLFNSSDGHDTVGAVALDCHGNVACATSTGGITHQIAGRISDSPIPGCGGFADNASVAVSTTGHGESIMKVNLARLVAFHVENGSSPDEAIVKSLKHMTERVKGSGGVIALDASGRVGINFSCEKMSWACVQPHGDVTESYVEYGVDLLNIRKEKI